MSIKPGSTVCEVSRISVSSAPGSRKPGSIAWIFPCEMMSVTRSRGGAPVASISRPAWMMVSAALTPHTASQTSTLQPVARKIIAAALRKPENRTPHPDLGTGVARSIPDNPADWRVGLTRRGHRLSVCASKSRDPIAVCEIAESGNLRKNSPGWKGTAS